MCSSFVVGKDAIIRDCRGIGRMGIVCKVGIIDHSVRSDCEGVRGCGGKGEGGE
jgi:hypothetical protein